MGRINVGKVIVGGVVAGIVMNAIDFVINSMVMSTAFEAVNSARNIAPEIAMASNTIGIMVALDFLLALTLVFTYAAIRPRFGAGPRSAVIAALVIAAASNITAGYFAASGFFPWGLWAKAGALATGNYLIAALVGGALYKE